MNKNDFYLKIINEVIENPNDIIAIRKPTTDGGLKNIIHLPKPTVEIMYNVITELKHKVNVSRLLSFLDLYHPFIFTKSYSNRQYNIGYVVMKADSYFYNIDGRTLVDTYNLPFARGIINDEAPISSELYQVDASYCRAIGTNDIGLIDRRNVFEHARSDMFNNMVDAAIMLNTMDLLHTDTSIFEDY